MDLTHGEVYLQHTYIHGHSMCPMLQALKELLAHPHIYGVKESICFPFSMNIR